MKNKVMNQ
jgi:hypothetical protein